MTFPLSYKRKVVLPAEDPENYSKKIIESLCEALNNENKCKAKHHNNELRFDVKPWDLMSWRAFSFINAGTLKAKIHPKEVELKIRLSFSQSAIIILLLSLVFRQYVY